MENGKKISIDSATLMNKVFELVEAQKIFNLKKEKIDILISSRVISSRNYKI